MDPKYQELLEKIQKLIDSSTLTPEDKKLLTDRVPLLSTVALEIIVELLEQDPSSLEKLVKSTRLKISAQDNPEKIKEIIEQEREEFTRAVNEG
jgi:hypothetical protein